LLLYTDRVPKNAEGVLIPGTLSPRRAVPSSITPPEYVGRKEPREGIHGDHYSAEDIEKIRVAGKIAAGALDAVEAEIRPGVTTDLLDAVAHEYLLDHARIPPHSGIAASQSPAVHRLMR